MRSAQLFAAVVTLSHCVNVVFVTVIPILILCDTVAMRTVYGPDGPARRILACIYATIALASGVALCAQYMGYFGWSVETAKILFPMQIIYKLATLPAVGWVNPVANSNVAIAARHSITLVALSLG